MSEPDDLSDGELAKLAKEVADRLERRGVIAGGSGLAAGGILGHLATRQAQAADNSVGQFGATGESVDVVLDQLRDDGGDVVADLDDSGDINWQGRGFDNLGSVDTDVLSGADIQNASSGQVPKSQGDGTLAMGSAGGVGEASTAYLSSDQSISANTVTKVQLDTSEFDTDSGWDLTNHQYVVQTAGKYLVTGTLQYKSASSGASVRGFLYVNGASKARFRSKSHGGSPSRAVTRSFDLAANDTIDFRTEHTDSSSQSLEGLQRITYLNVVRVA